MKTENIKHGHTQIFNKWNLLKLLFTRNNHRTKTNHTRPAKSPHETAHSVNMIHGGILGWEKASPPDQKPCHSQTGGHVHSHKTCHAPEDPSNWT